MLLRTALALALLVHTSTADCNPNENSNSCADPDEDTICKINCPRDRECAPVDADKCTASIADIADLTYANVLDQCEQKCVDSKEAGSDGDINTCRFYKADNQGVLHVCSLMNDKQCQDKGSCGSHCESGDVGCPSSPYGPCKGGVEYSGSPFNFACFDVDIYSAETVPEGTKCWTTERCSGWEAEGVANGTHDWRRLAITCGNTGTWGRAENSGGSDEDYLAVLGADGAEAPVEPTCEPESVLIHHAVFEEDGADFLCDTEPTSDGGDPEYFQIVAPNTCILLCDFHLAMSLDCRITSQGTSTAGSLLPQILQPPQGLLLQPQGLLLQPQGLLLQPPQGLLPQPPHRLFPPPLQQHLAAPLQHLAPPLQHLAPPLQHLAACEAAISS